jgi:hypothetical protein
MIIGDGDSSKLMRANILNADFAFGGIFSGTHTTNGHQTCLVFSQTYTDNVYDKDAVLTPQDYIDIDTDLFSELNALRANPRSYVPLLEAMKANFIGFKYKVSGKFAITT